MVQHRNPSIVWDAARLFNTKVDDHISDQVNPVIQPTIEIKPRLDVVRSLNSQTSGTMTIFTTPTNKDFYLVTANLSIIKDVVADLASGALIVRCRINNRNADILLISLLTLTAQDISTANSYDPPIKLDRGTTITVPGTFTVGAVSRSAAIAGYTVETTIED